MAEITKLKKFFSCVSRQTKLDKIGCKWSPKFCSIIGFYFIMIGSIIQIVINCLIYNADQKILIWPTFAKTFISY